MAIKKPSIESDFSQIPNKLIVDTTLSPGAFRVVAYLYSKPKSWTACNQDIQRQLKIKQRNTLAKYWKELISSGWVSRKKKPGGRGYDYELRKTQSMEKPHSGSRSNVRLNHTLESVPKVWKKRVWKNHTLSNTEISNNDNQNPKQKRPCQEEQTLTLVCTSLEVAS